MSLMNALTSGASIAPKGEGGEVKLGADAETLALFAQLFAMIQAPSETADTTEGAALPADGKPAPVTSGQPNAEPLPAAAMLMAAHGIGPAPDIEDIEVDDEATRLTKLLVAAGSLLAPPSEPEATPVTDPATDTFTDPVAAVVQPAEAGDPRPMTATEMLTNAIEILRRLDEPPASAAMVAKPDDAINGAAGPATQPAVHAMPQAGTVPVVILPASPDFVGPMPMVVSTTQQAAAPPSAAFVGPMPVIADIAAQHIPVVAPPSAEFVGPMPVMAVAPQPFAQLSSPEFVGPMPALPVVSQVVIAPPAAEFVGPMPALASATPAASQQGVMIPPSPSFVGPMPAIPLASIPLAGETVSSAPATPAAMMSASANASISGGMEEQGPEPRQIMTEAKAAPRDFGRKAIFGKAGQPQQAGATSPIIDDVSTATLRRALTGYDALSAGAGQQAASQSQAQQSGTQSGSASNGQSAAQQVAQAMAGATGGQSGGQQGGHGGGAQTAAQQLVDAGASQDSAGRTMLYRLNTANAGWSETMVRRLTSDLQSGVQTVRIILEPRQLGRLNVELGLRGGNASIRIAAESAEAAKLLSGARGQLGSMLESAGLRLAGFQTAGMGGDVAGDSGHSQDGRAGGENAGGNKEFSNKMAAAQTQADDADAADGPPETSLRDGETAVLSILA